MKRFFKIRSWWEGVFFLVMLYGMISAFLYYVFDFDISEKYVHPFVFLTIFGYFSLYFFCFIYKTMFTFLCKKTSGSLAKFFYKIIFAVSSISFSLFFLSAMSPTSPIFPNSIPWELFVVFGFSVIYPMCLLSRFHVFPDLRKESSSLPQS